MDQESMPKLDASDLPQQLLNWTKDKAEEWLATDRVDDGTMLGVVAVYLGQLHEMADRLRIELGGCAREYNNDWPQEERDRLKELCERAWVLIHGEE